MNALRLLALAVLPVLGVSCKSDDPYAANGGDPYAGGGYNPYPSAQGGYPQQSSGYPQYQPPPNSVPQPDPYSYSTPPSSPPPAPAPSYSSGGGGGASHTVVRGDTLYSLSRRYGTSVSAIKSANGLSSDLIIIGQTLTIP